MKYIAFGDIVEPNGKTIRENNLAIPHNIPIGTLVEVKYAPFHGGGACEKVHARLWVVSHDRDCDGSPLYSLSPHPKEKHLRLREEIMVFNRSINDIRTGFTEADLTPVKVTPAMIDGKRALRWRRVE